MLRGYSPRCPPETDYSAVFAYKVLFRRTGMEKMKNAELPLQKQILGFIDRLMTNRLSAIRFFIPAVLAEYDDI